MCCDCNTSVCIGYRKGQRMRDPIEKADFIQRSSCADPGVVLVCFSVTLRKLN